LWFSSFSFSKQNGMNRRLGKGPILEEAGVIANKILDIKL